jgi:carbonic anhydrase
MSMALPDSITKDQHYKNRIVTISSVEEIPEQWRKSPIEQLIEFINFGKPIPDADHPRLLISACIDYRFSVAVPHGFAYVIRCAGGRLLGSEFAVAYCLSRGVKHIVLLGHNDCGMTKVPHHAEPMIKALVNEGWDKDRAEEFVMMRASQYAISDEVDALEKEYRRLKRLFHKVTIAPLIACLAEKKLYLPSWYNANSYNDETHTHGVSDKEILALS